MKFDDLLYFFNVAKSRSTSIAAEQLNVSQPTISLALKRLEQELGVPLVSRTYRGMALTKAGEEIYKKIPDILNTIEEIKEIAKKYQKIEPPICQIPDMTTIQINVHDTISSSFPENVVADACKNKIFPQISSVQFSLLDTLEMGFPYADKDCAIFFINSKNYNIAKIPEEYVVEVLSASKIFYIVSKNNSLFDDMKSISYEEIAKYPIIYPSNINDANNAGAILYNSLQKYGSPKTVMYCEKIFNIMNIVANTNYGAILFKGFNNTASNLEDAVKFIPISDSKKYLIIAIYRKDHPNADKIRFITSALKNDVATATR